MWLKSRFGNNYRRGDYRIYQRWAKMSGQIILAGGAEFQKGYESPDKRALELAGGVDAYTLILPTANVQHPDWASREGVNWFKKLGATHVEGLALTNRTSANDPAILEKIAAAKLIYLSGGDPSYLLTTLKNSAGWEAALGAWANGAVLGGSSAGAMAVCEFMYNPGTGQVLQGLGLVPNLIVIPHHNGGAKNWFKTLYAAHPDAIILGIDEHTAAIGHDNDWQALGQGWVTVYRQGKATKYASHQPFKLAI